MEIGMDAFRKQIGSEELCDKLILEAMQKGPKRVRILSREELKIEINKFKNISLRLMDELKANKIKVPGYASKSSGLQTRETGFREETKKEMTALDHLEGDAASYGGGHGGGYEMSFNTNDASEGQLI